MFREIFGPKNAKAINVQYYLTKTCFVGSDRAGLQKVEVLECYVLMRQWIQNKRSVIIHIYSSAGISVYKARIEVISTCTVSCVCLSSITAVHIFCWRKVIVAITEVNVVLKMACHSNNVQKSGNVVYVWCIAREVYDGF